MTFVYAHKTGSIVSILADTMITMPLWQRPNLIPGELKIVHIAPRVTVAYASNQQERAISEIRRSATELRSGASVESICDLLKDITSSGLHEFIIVSSVLGSQRFLKIHRGFITEGPAEFRLGDPRPSALIAAKIKELSLREGLSEVPRHVLVFAAFLDVMHDGAGKLTESVGGIVINSTCSLSEHSYRQYQTVASYSEVEISGPVHKRIVRREMENDRIEIVVESGRVSGFPVLGVYLPEAEIGYVYNPLIYDGAEVIHGTKADLKHAIERKIETLRLLGHAQ